MSWFVPYIVYIQNWHRYQIYKSIELIFTLLSTSSSLCMCMLSCQTLCSPMDCSPPVSFVHGILQARVLEWVGILFSRGSSWPRNRMRISCITSGFFTIWAMRVVLSAYLRLLIFLLAILIPSFASSCPAFCMITRVTIYSLDIILSQFGTSPLFHIWF